MSDSKKILWAIVKNYACRKRIEEIENYISNRLQQEFQIKYLKPVMMEFPATTTPSHPFGGEMRNWSENPSAELLDVYDLAQSILDNNKYGAVAQLTTYPNLGTKQYLDPFNYYYLKPMIKGHEYKHYLAHSLPFNLAYIYGLKAYGQARKSNRQLSREEIAMQIKDWLDEEYKPNLSRFDHLKKRVDVLDKDLVGIEKEENIYYRCSDIIEEESFNEYKTFIDQMDFR